MRLNIKANPANQSISSNLPSLSVIIALIIVYLIWGSTYLGVRIALESYPPFIMTAIRLFISGLVIIGVLVVRGTALPSRRQILNAAFIGSLMFGGGAGLVAYAEQWVSSGLASLAVAAVPIWASIFAGFLGRWPGKLEWIGLLIGISGVALLNMENGMQANPMGAIVLLIGPMLWALGSMISRRIDMPQGFMAVTFQLLGGALALLVMSILVGESITETPTLKATLVLAYLTIFGTLLAFSAYMYLVQTVRPALATSYAYVNPVIAVLLGVIVLAENITPIGILAMFVILTGVVLVIFAKERAIEKPKN